MEKVILYLSIFATGLMVSQALVFFTTGRTHMGILAVNGGFWAANAAIQTSSLIKAQSRA